MGDDSVDVLMADDTEVIDEWMPDLLIQDEDGE